MEFHGVVFIVRNEFERFLLEQRNYLSKRDIWSFVFPGGARDVIDKTPLDCVRRELLEEFNIDASGCEIKEIGKYIKAETSTYSSICLLNIKHPLNFSINESAGACWLTLEEIDKITLGYSQNERVLPLLKEYLLNH